MARCKTLVLALALRTAGSAALTEREQLAAVVNSAGTTWVAKVGSDKDKPLHSSQHLYGVLEGSRAEFEELAKVRHTSGESA